MSVWANEASIALVLFALSFPVALIFLTYHQYHSHGKFRGWSAVVTTAAFLYGVGVVAFTLFPLPAEGRHDCVAGDVSTHWQLSPFSSLGDILDVWRMVGFPSVLTSTVFLQVAMNVVLLIPLGMLLAYRYKKSFTFTVAVGLGTSLLIELTQGTAVFGVYDCPYRLADVDDLVTNTAGAAIGWLIVAAIGRWLPDPTPPPDPDLDPPSVLRRVLSGALDLLTLVLVGAVATVAVNAVFLAVVNTTDHAWYQTSVNLVGTVGVGIVLFLVVPLVRSDSSTPGQIATWLAGVSNPTDQAAAPRQILIRFAVRWSPILVGVFLEPLAIIVGVVVYESVTVALRHDRRSLSAVTSATKTVTRRSLPGV